MKKDLLTLNVKIFIQEIVLSLDLLMPEDFDFSTRICCLIQMVQKNTRHQISRFKNHSTNCMMITNAIQQRVVLIANELLIQCRTNRNCIVLIFVPNRQIIKTTYRSNVMTSTIRTRNHHATLGHWTSECRKLKISRNAAAEDYLQNQPRYDRQPFNNCHSSRDDDIRDSSIDTISGGSSLVRFVEI